MTYGLMQTVPLPIEAYEQIHAQIGAAQVQRPAHGLLVHFARTTEQGYQVVEVWESKEDCDRFFAEVVNPIVERFAAGRPLPSAPAIEEFEVHGLVTPVAAPDRQDAPSVPSQSTPTQAHSPTPAAPA